MAEKAALPMLRFGLPLGVFLAVVVLLGIGLNLNPREVPSPLIDKPAPAFELPQLHAPERTFSPKEMAGQVWVFNVWASWCAACRAGRPPRPRLRFLTEAGGGGGGVFPRGLLGRARDLCDRQARCDPLQANRS